MKLGEKGKIFHRPLPQRGPVQDTEADIEFAMENPFATNLRQLKVKNQEEAHDEHWAGDYGGPMFLLPGLNEDGEWALCIWSAKYHVSEAPDRPTMIPYEYQRNLEELG
ncbi:unnamed protein product [Malus baccata var. baccata]